MQCALFCICNTVGSKVRRNLRSYSRKLSGLSARSLWRQN